MKNILSIALLFLYASITAQINNPKKVDLYNSTRKIEDRKGHLITDSIARKLFFEKRLQHLNAQQTKSIKSTFSLTAVPLCTNGSFEEFETISGNTILKNFEYTTGEPLNPMQCKSVSENANIRIKQYDPADFDLMASTVPSNFIDEYIGNINAFDQYSLKINFKDSYLTMGLIQAKRYKTNNETQLKFNYKAVLQSITESDHENEQPYFKARVINSAGNVVDEFCLIGTPSNCIFTQAPIIEEGSIILYTPNWQSGILDISNIPNNETFTIEFMAARCGLNGHFGYAYVDDICLLHSTENLQGSIVLDPINSICPTLPLAVCGSFTLPNSGGINAFISSINLTVQDQNNSIVYTNTTQPTIDLVTNRFCFELPIGSLPNILDGTYNVGATINFGITQTNCSGTSFNSAFDNDANPGWDIWYLNCTNCDVPLQATKLTLCDLDHNGTASFNLTNANTAIVGAQTGLSFNYFATLVNATNDVNPIANFLNYESSSTTVFVRVTLNPSCYKIIPLQLIVKNPSTTISGILNICSGSTTLTASPGASYLWGTSLETTQSISVTATGNYNVTVTDNDGCSSVASVTILASGTAPLPSLTLTQPTCFTSAGTIHVTSPASEYSYDGGITWGTNSIMSNLPYGNYLVKIRTLSGCTSYNSSVNIIPYLSSFPNFSSVSPTICGGFGSITITTPATEYSFDDGATWSTSNTAIGLTSGTYLIRTKDAQGCISNFNSVTLSSEFLSPPLFIKDNPYCGNPGSIIITTPASEYSFDGGTTWQTSNTLSNLVSDSYIIKIKDAQGCTSPNVYVYLTDLENTYPNYEIIEAGCGTYASISITTPGDFYSFDGGLTWSTSPVLNSLNGPSNYHLKVKKGIGCISYQATAYLYNSFLQIPSANDFHTTLCDSLNDGSENVNLTLYNANLIANSNNFSFSYYTSLTAAETGNYLGLINNYSACNLNNINNKVYVRVTSSDNCYKVVELKFDFIDSPRIYMEDRYPLCEFKNVILDAGSGYDSYLWTLGQTTQAISIIAPDDYWVKVTENHGTLVCDSRKDFTVFLSNPATITKIEEIDWTEIDNSITVYVTGKGNYEYSLDGVNYQDEKTFYGLRPGIYEIFVRDKYGCGVVADTALLLNYSKYFTPNDDGYNDSWRIRLSEFEPDINIKIFDRYGKLLKTMGSNESWDGTYNGNLMPSDDYWFYVNRSDGKIHRGHFTMKR